jgi:nitroreductase
MNILKSLEWRYAVKKFDPSKRLTPEQIDLIKNAFNLTASSFGLQPVKMMIISNEELKEKMVPLSYYQRQVADASHLIVLCVKKYTTADDIHRHFDLVREIRGTSEEILSKFRNELIETYNKKSPEEQLESAKNQAYIILGNLMTVCAVEKIDTCPMEGFMPDKVDALLNLSEQNLQSILLLPIGYRDESDFMNGLKKVRKSLSDTIIEIP